MRNTSLAPTDYYCQVEAGWGMDVEDLVILRIRELAEGKRLSMNRLADFAGFDRGHLSRIMNRKSSPTLRTLKKIAAALEVEVAELLKMPPKS